MSLVEDDVRRFVSGLANTFSLLHDVLEEDASIAGGFLQGFVRGDRASVEDALRQATIDMDYRPPGDDGAYRLSFQIGRLTAVLDLREGERRSEAV